MSKIVDSVDSLDQNQSQGPDGAKDASILSRMSVVLWLAASITATVFSFQMGVRQGRQEAVEAVSPKQWLYYFSENEDQENETPAEEAAEAPKTLQAALPAASPKPAPSASPKANALPLLNQSGFAIQLVTYENKEMAQQEAERISKKGHQAFVVPSGKYFLVCMNLAKDRKTVIQKLAQLNKAGFTKVYPGAYVRTVGKKKSGQEA